MTVKTEPNHSGGFLVTELPGRMSRRIGVVNTGQVLLAGAVLGQLLFAAAPVAGANTGNGAVTVGAIGRAAKTGTYKLVCVVAAANAGTFNFYAPDGTLVRQITVGGGATASDHLIITIADGSTDFVAGDSFSITVSGGDFEAFDPTEDDGAQIAAGVLFAGADASGGDQACVVIDNTAVVNGAELVWPEGITVPQKDAAIAQLNARGILLR